MPIKTFFTAIIIPLSLAFPCQLWGQSIALYDCQGFTRAAQSVEENSLNKVEVSVSDSAGAATDGSQVTLTNVATGEVSTAVVQNGVAVFENIAPGAFTISSASETLVVGTVGIGSMGAGIAVAAGAAVVGAGAVGGAGAVAISTTVDAVEGENSDPDPTPTAVPTTSPTATPAAPQPTRAPTPTPIDCNCDPNAEPEPIDDFFQNNPAATDDFQSGIGVTSQGNEISPFS